MDRCLQCPTDCFAVTFPTPGQTLISPLDIASLSWGDVTTRGLPFYVGNVVYNYTFSLPNSPSITHDLTLTVPQFSSPVLVVHSLPSLTERNAGAGAGSQAKKLGRIAFQPHTLHLGKFAAGTHRISITAYGNRYNAFGHFHLADGRTNQCWPDIWRSKCSFISAKSSSSSTSCLNVSFAWIFLVLIPGPIFSL